MDRLNTARAAKTRKRSRIRVRNEERILDAALDIFSAYGLRGATVDQIAEQAGMSKPNLLYYFRRKQDIYVAVLRRTLEMWLAPFEGIRESGDPEEEIRRYIEQKLEFSRIHPKGSRLFLNEVLQGAPMLRPILETRVRDLVEQKAGVLRKWAEEGKIAPVDPYHFIFMIWAMTQHYADFEAQIEAVLPGDGDRDALYEKAKEVVETLVFRGILPR